MSEREIEGRSIADGDGDDPHDLHDADAAAADDHHGNAKLHGEPLIFKMSPTGRGQEPLCAKKWTATSGRNHHQILSTWTSPL